MSSESDSRLRELFTYISLSLLLITIAENYFNFLSPESNSEDEFEKEIMSYATLMFVLFTWSFKATSRD